MPRARGDRFGHDACVRRLAAFSTEWHGREIRAIGFDHELPKRDLRGHLSHGQAVLESYDPGERDEVVEVDNGIRLLQRAAEAVKDAAHLSRVRFHDLQRVIPGVALMNDDIQPELRGEIELLFKQTGLFRFVGAVVDLRLRSVLRSKSGAP